MSSLSKRRSDSSESIGKKYDQGVRLQAQGRFAEAESRFRKVLTGDPHHLGALRGLAQALIALERQTDAMNALDNAAADIAGDEDYIFDLANICLGLRHYRQAEALFTRVLELKPDMPPALVNLGQILDEKGETQRAVDMISRAIEIKPDYAEAYSLLGKTLTRAAMFDDAIACYRRSIELNPNIAMTYTNLGALLETEGYPREALKACEKALQLNPDCDATRWNLARSLLAVGEVEAGWDMFGFGFACGQRKPYRPFPGLIWEGEDLTGKTIMVWREQGLGDDLFFSTCYAELVEKVGPSGKVIIETDARLVPLYQRTWPEATVRPEKWISTGLGNYGEVDFDFTAPAGIVAGQLRRKLADFPARVHALVPDPVRVAGCRAWLDTLGAGPKIGLAWSSRNVNRTRELSYTKLADWKELFATPGLQVVNLQYTDIEEEAAAFEREFGLTLHRMPGLDLFNDLEGVAALTSCMTATVAPSSFPGVMSGALGVPCFYYLRPGGWPQLGTDRLPWFPDMRCYPMGAAKDRDRFFAKIIGDVRAFVGL